MCFQENFHESRNTIIVVGYARFPIQGMVISKKNKYNQHPNVLATTEFLNENVVVSQEKKSPGQVNSLANDLT